MEAAYPNGNVYEFKICIYLDENFSSKKVFKSSKVQTVSARKLIFDSSYRFLNFSILEDF